MPIEYSNHQKPGVLEVPDTLRRTLKRLAENTYRRGPRRWETPSAPGISHHTVTELAVRNMVKVRHGRGRDRLDLTDLGKEIVDRLVARRNGGAS